MTTRPTAPDVITPVVDVHLHPADLTAALMNGFATSTAANYDDTARYFMAFRL